MILSFFLGMCSYLAISKKIEPSIGLGAAVIFVCGICTPVNWVIKNYLLDEGALYWILGDNALDIDLTFLAYIAYFTYLAYFAYFSPHFGPCKKYSATLHLDLFVVTSTYSDRYTRRNLESPTIPFGKI